MFNILVCSNFLVLIILAFLTTYLRSSKMQYLIHGIHGVAVGLLLSHIILLGFYVVPLDNFKSIIVSMILLVLPLSSNIVDFILPGWRQIFIATAQNWPATWQTRPMETSEMVVHCTCTPCFKFCTPTFKILRNNLSHRAVGHSWQQDILTELQCGPLHELEGLGVFYVHLLLVSTGL